MRERFIAAEEFNDLNVASLVVVDHVEGGEALFDGEVDMDDVYFRSQMASASAIRRGSGDRVTNRSPRRTR